MDFRSNVFISILFFTFALLQLAEKERLHCVANQLKCGFCLFMPTSSCTSKPFDRKVKTYPLNCCNAKWLSKLKKNQWIISVKDFPEGCRVSSCSCCRGCWMTGGRLLRWSVQRARGSPPRPTLRTGIRSRCSSRAWQRGGPCCWTKLRPGVC